MEKWARINYQPCLPLGKEGRKVTGSDEHIALARRAATEGAVLLKNEKSTLPLKRGTKVTLFGKAQHHYVKGGGGSGYVYSAYSRSLYEGLKMKEGVAVFEPLSLYYKDYVKKESDDGVSEEDRAFVETKKIDEAPLPDDLLRDARAFTDTAIITLCRFSSEGSDRRGDGTDPYFELSSQEKNMVDRVSEAFERVVVVLNTGAMIDTSCFAENDRIQALLMLWQAGMEGGLACADILTGEATPSGKLVDTCAKTLSDYPSTQGFHESESVVKYTEDVFVGYRYFETVPHMKERVVYPFGFGLSYTDFEISDIKATALDGKIKVSCKVQNVGAYSGKEVVQVYYSAPLGKISKPALELSAFKKTALLKPSESETLEMEFAVTDMASYDDMGEVERSAWVMEKGGYRIYVGNSVRNITPADFTYDLNEDVVVEKLTEYCYPARLGRRMLSDGSFRDVPDRATERKAFAPSYSCKVAVPENDEDIKTLSDVASGKVTLDDFLAQLTDEEMVALLKGVPSTGVGNIDGMGGLKKYGIPAPMTIDGPAGVRIAPKTGVRTTAFPVATMLACSWDTDLLEEIGRVGALEVKENNLSMWLTPALNIHRNPLCGRNFEYYSEDPFVSGKMAAAMVRGIQSQNIVACPKHFACNNKETNRTESDSVVSERALREIYLKGFEICVKEADPRLIMTSYNIVNGIHASENAELITGILRGEWGYRGLVTTDWWNTASHKKEVVAGNDIRMPSTAKDDLKAGDVDRNVLAQSVKRLLELILWLE